MLFSHVKKNEQKKIAEIKQFLQANQLGFDDTITIFVTLHHQQRLVACGGIAGNVIKCVAIDVHCRGEGIALSLATELIHLAYEQQQRELFIYTKIENEPLFQQCGFYRIADVPQVMVLMENSRYRLQHYIQQLTNAYQVGKKIGCIVLNANPFTYGHRYLIEQALSRCDWLHLFLVKEEAAYFSYQQRWQLVQAGIRDLSRVTLHQGSPYIISRATFPDYFLKEQARRERCYSEMDLNLFRCHLAPALGITDRFVGSEPHCTVTRQYNRDMHYWLSTTAVAAPVIRVTEIERLTYQQRAISAAWVRQLLQQKQLSPIMPLVPPTTWQHLQTLALAQSACGAD